jgi:heat-inducible transcriptional repressor
MPQPPHHSPSLPELNERAQYLLKALVERYIQDGQPVGSRCLAKETDLQLSPATIRNVMADLEEYGLVTSPHTSAGRIPTVSGYRFFVDSLLTIRPLQQNLVHELELSLSPQNTHQGLLQAASKLLSASTQMAGVVTLPLAPQRVVFRHIEFLPLSHGRVLVILVTNQEEVHNRIIQPDRPFSEQELQTAANYLNALCQGWDLAKVSQDIRNELLQDRYAMNQELLDAAHMAELALQNKQSDSDKDFLLSGETNLMTFAELSSLAKLRDMFEAFSYKQDIMHLLDRCLAADGVQIFIGEESGYKPLDQCSLVTTTYAVDNQVVGVLGVIGPTRMAYERVIPLVDVTAKLLGAALNQKI